MTRCIAVLHGVNLDALGRRPAAHYGDITLAQLESRIEQFAASKDLRVRCFQTNHEGDYVEELHRVHEYADALILNPGAWTHYAWAVRDALEIAALPTVEVHLSSLAARETFRQQSVIADLCLATISGEGSDGYRQALELLRMTLVTNSEGSAPNSANPLGTTSSTH